MSEKSSTFFSKLRSQVNNFSRSFNIRYYSTNLERNENYNLQKDFWKNRQDGISAMMRIKNEEDWIEYSLKSIKDVFDEIVIVFQNSTDNSENIVRSLNLPNVQIYHYPFESFPNKPNYFKHPQNSIYNRAYFYNWVLGKTKRKWVFKWDGDQALFENAGEILRNVVKEEYDIIHFKGIDLYGRDLAHMCKTPHCASEPSLFKVTKKTFYYPGDFCEYFSYPVWKSFLVKSKIYNIPEPLFLHFKYATDSESLGKGWPDNWREIKFFTDIIANKSEGEPYNGDYPAVLKPYFNKLVNK